MKRKGPWSEAQIAGFLADTRVPLRLACHGASGHPVLASLWFVPIADTLFCATPRHARVAAHLRRDGRCAFEVARESPPYCGVRGQADATLHEDRGEEILHRLVQRYVEDPSSPFARWLLARADRETAIAIAPRAVVSWDFRDRMGGGA